MTIGIVMPVHARVPALVDMTYHAVESFTRQDAAETLALWVKVNRLPPLIDDFTEHLARCWEPGRSRHLGWDLTTERCVAGSWNAGIAMLRAAEPDLRYITCINNDVVLKPATLATLAAYGDAHPEVALWSAVNTRDHPTPETGAVPGCDFSCFMVRPTFPDVHGRFDEGFTPAYYEDNDMYARVVLGGGRARVVLDARYFHAGSQTIRHDPQAETGNNRSFTKNHAYFVSKWGRSPADSDDEIRLTYYPRPFNDPTKPLTWWPDVSPERAAEFW